MQTQKDHVDAYADQMGRLSSALLLGDAVALERPARRAVLALAGGTVLAVLIGVVCGVYGLIRPGGSEVWREAGAVLVEKETGSRYVYVGGALHSVANYSSALLVQGADAHLERISTASLAGLPRGAPMGIDGAPDTVPAAEDLLTAGWTRCLPAAAPGNGANGQGEVTSGLDFDAGTPTTPLPATTMALVRSTQGTQYAVVAGTRHAVADALVPVVLGVQDDPVPTAPDDWLDQLPAGPDLAPVRPAGSGSPGPVVGGRPRLVGDVLSHTAGNGREQLFVVLADGIAPLPEFDAALTRAAAAPVAPLDADALARAPRSATSLAGRLPDLLRAGPADPTRSLCLAQGADPADPATVRTAVVTVPADRALTRGVRVTPGRGVLVAGVPLPADGTDPDLYLVADTGRRHLIADGASAEALGLGDVAPQAVPGPLLQGVPPGPDLSRTAAGAPDDGNGTR